MRKKYQHYNLGPSLLGPSWGNFCQLHAAQRQLLRPLNNQSPQICFLIIRDMRVKTSRLGAELSDLKVRLPDLRFS